MKDFLDGLLRPPANRLGFGEAGAPDTPPDGDGADLAKDPRVQQLLRAKVAEERAAAERRTAELVKNRDDILAEKRRWADLGSHDEVAQKLARLTELESAAAAAEVGSDPTEFKRAVDEAAEVKFREAQRRDEKVSQKREQDLVEALTRADAAEAQAHRNFVETCLLEACIPPEMRLFQPGARAQVLDAIAPHVVQVEVAGRPRPLDRIEVNGTRVPGNTNDMQLDVRGLVDELRRPGETNPLGLELAYCFISGASGSGGAGNHAGGGPPPSDNWQSMTEEQRDVFVRDHGVEEAQKLIERSVTTQPN